ncbi:4Fe-4S dicluster domain-containing protein [Salinibacter altiplanensis]|uniref:4Fe-4S dicluster domain-containing protein n=1 Tax=Salinibacter altiplanensis TaxID=1803181 RepID=UPI000C9ECF80|nr:4Fe-4S dicluster domain-containing protein [Salinibacter altiplanensis]
MGQLGMVIDLERCYGCRACMEACKVENSTSRGAFWMHVFRYEEGEYPDTKQSNMPRPCQHCSEPSCVAACPTGARFKREEDGIVLTDYDRCIGCRYCEIGCPYGVNYAEFQHPEDAQYGYGSGGSAGDDTYGAGSTDEELGEENPGSGKPPWHDPIHDQGVEPRGTKMSGPQPEGVMSKCTFCVHRQDNEERGQQGTTACQQTCPVDAIKFGDMDDPDSEPRRHLRKKHSSPVFRLLEDRGTEPNVIYMGEEPGPNAQPIEDAGTFKDPEEAIKIENNPPASREKTL